MASFPSYCLGCAVGLDNSDAAYCSSSCRKGAADSDPVSLQLGNAQPLLPRSQRTDRTTTTTTNRVTPVYPASNILSPRTSSSSNTINPAVANPPSPSFPFFSPTTTTRNPHQRPGLVGRHTISYLSNSLRSSQNKMDGQQQQQSPPMSLLAMTRDSPEVAAFSKSPAGAIYRELYPKFSARRSGTGLSPRTSISISRQGSMSESGSTLSSDTSLLTPSSLLRYQSLPPSGSCDGSGGGRGVSIELEMDDQAPTTSQPYALRSADLASNAHESPYKHRSPFVHVPERRTAPKRSLDMSRIGFTSYRTSSRTISPGDLSLFEKPNCLGLDIEHLENVPSPPEQATSPSSGVRRTNKSVLTSPPSCRSPLASIQIANAMGQLEVQEDGFRSVEGSRYTLGEKEATYIAKRLMEEQKRRQMGDYKLKQQKTRGSSVNNYTTNINGNSNGGSGGMTEERGRSRAKKRAASWSIAMHQM